MKKLLNKRSSFFMKKYCVSIFSVLLIIALSLCSGVMPSVSAENDFLKNDAKASLLVDYETGTVLYENNSNARFPIASMVKLMTILLTYEAIDNGSLTLDTMITTSENASGMGGSQVFIDPYVEYRAEDLLKSVVMASANDASVALAEYISGSEGAFVSLMNKRASELGMKNTLYANCTGLPAPEQYSSAYDCYLVLKQLLKHEHYHTLSTIWMDKLVHPSGRETELVNTNKLIRYYEGCDCGKTGSTSEAGYCLTASCIRNDFRLVAVVIGSKNGQQRFTDVSSLFNYGFANYENKLILDSQTPYLTDVEVRMSKQKTVDVYAKESFYGLSRKGNNDEYEFKYELDEIKAPIKAGEKVGTLLVTKQGQVVKEIDLVVNSDLQKLTYFDSIKRIAENW